MIIVDNKVQRPAEPSTGCANVLTYVAQDEEIMRRRRNNRVPLNWISRSSTAMLCADQSGLVGWYCQLSRWPNYLISWIRRGAEEFCFGIRSAPQNSCKLLSQWQFTTTPTPQTIPQNNSLRSVWGLLAALCTVIHAMRISRLTSKDYIRFNLYIFVKFVKCNLFFKGCFFILYTSEFIKKS